MKPIAAAALAFLLMAAYATIGATEASNPSAATDPSADASSGGELRAVGDSGNSHPFPLKHTDVRAEINGSIAHVRVSQVFQNPYDRAIEAIYVFPLPRQAAVDDKEIRIGDRTIRGVIERREEARAQYEQARSSGRTAALLDQERPNIFTQSVANILPGEEIVVSLRYFDLLPYASASYEFVFPMVVGPRFIPGEPIGKTGSGWADDTTDVPDASRITPPVMEPGTRSGRDISLEIDLRAGLTIQALDSPTHLVDLERPAPGQARIKLHQEDSVPNKDFVLRYRIDGAAPGLALLPHRAGKQGSFLALIQPEAQPSPAHITPKEMIFVVDCSGSMSGFPIDMVKRAMHYALDNLNPLDNFQIIRFSNSAESFAPQPVPATPSHLALAHDYVQALSGAGGTIMLDGVQTALSFPEDPQRLRIISFMTDGYIGNETQILAYLRANLGGARLFSFGVGSSPNRYLLDKMAEFGKGDVQYLLPQEDAEKAVKSFYDRIRSPYLTNLALDWGTLQVSELFPKELPDLFLGQPIAVFGAYGEAGAGEITLRGRLGGQPYEQKLRVELPEKAEAGEAIGTLWARSKIEELSDRMIASPQSSIVEEITEVALAHHLVSSYTSFVAVEDRPRTEGGAPLQVPVPVPLADGMQEEKPKEGAVTGGAAGGVIGGVIGGVVGGVPGGVPAAAPHYPERIRVMGRGKVVNTESTQLSTTISTEFLSGLPILGTDYQDVLGLAHGATDCNVHGGRDTDVVTLVDCASTLAGNPGTGLNLASLQEIEVIVSAAGASAVGDDAWTSDPDGGFPFACQLRTVRASYRAGEPIQVFIAIRNLSAKKLRVPDALSISEGTAHFRILDEEWNAVAQPASGSCLEKKRFLAPGDWIVYKLTLNGEGGYRLARPGLYHVVFMGSELGLPDSTQLTLRIEP